MADIQPAEIGEFTTLIEALENSWVAKLTTETVWGFPINEIVHILSISVVVGICVVYAANTLIQSGIEPKALRRYTTPLCIIAFAIAFLTGFIFFAAWPERYLGNPAFLVKLILLTILLILQTLIWRGYGSKADSRIITVYAWTSLVVSIATIAAGRLIAYLA